MHNNKYYDYIIYYSSIFSNVLKAAKIFDGVLKCAQIFDDVLKAAKGTCSVPEHSTWANVLN
jgi:hypothetical protein